MRASKRVRQRRRVESLSGMTARAFVTTYGVGNERGFATGKWFDLTKFANQKEFYIAASRYAEEVLGDDDAELCFSDYECSFGTEGLMSETEISQDVWEILNSDISEDDLNMLKAYRQCQGMGSTKSYLDILEEAQDHFVGEFRNDVEMAESHIDNTINLDDLPDIIAYNIDYQGVARDLMVNMLEDNGYYFDSF